jgi:aspartokinase
MRAGIPLWIKSVFEDSPGTLVTHGCGRAEPAVVSKIPAITGITQLLQRVQFVVEACPEGDKKLEAVLQSLLEQGANPDLITLQPDQLAFIVPCEEAAEVAELLAGLDLVAKQRPGCARVTVVAREMGDVADIMLEVVVALSAHGLPLLHVSHTTASVMCLTDEDCIQTALEILVEHFELN